MSDDADILDALRQIAAAHSDARDELRQQARALALRTLTATVAAAWQAWPELEAVTVELREGERPQVRSAQASSAHEGHLADVCIGIGWALDECADELRQALRGARPADCSLQVILRPDGMHVSEINR